MWNVIEYAGFAVSAAYLIFEILQKRIMWAFGIFSALLYMAVFINSELYASASMQLYYLAVSIVGWFKWGRDTSEGGVIVKPSLRVISISSIIALPGFILLYLVLYYFSSDPAPLADAFIATLSMLATYWLSLKYLEQWYLWMVANSCAVILCFTQELYLTSLLYIIYLIASIIGYFRWRNFERVLD